MARTASASGSSCSPRSCWLARCGAAAAAWSRRRRKPGPNRRCRALAAGSRRTAPRRGARRAARPPAPPPRRAAAQAAARLAGRSRAAGRRRARCAAAPRRRIRTPCGGLAARQPGAARASARSSPPRALGAAGQPASSATLGAPHAFVVSDPLPKRRSRSTVSSDPSALLRPTRSQLSALEALDSGRRSRRRRTASAQRRDATRSSARATSLVRCCRPPSAARTSRPTTSRSRRAPTRDGRGRSRRRCSHAARQRDPAARPPGSARSSRSIADEHADVRHRSGRHGKDISRHRDGGARAQANARSRGSFFSRPAVEAGEKLGFLPGDLKEKVDPYLRPLYDALGELLDDATVAQIPRARHDRSRAARVHARTHALRCVRDPRRSAERDARAAEDVPHAPGQRLEDGRHRRRDANRSAARRCAAACSMRPRCFSGIDDIGIVRIDETDVVRHPLVAKIVAAYRAPETRKPFRCTLRTARAAPGCAPLRCARTLERLLAAVGAGGCERFAQPRGRRGDARAQPRAPRQGRADRRAELSALRTGRVRTQRPHALARARSSRSDARRHRDLRRHGAARKPPRTMRRSSARSNGC